MTQDTKATLLALSLQQGLFPVAAGQQVKLSGLESQTRAMAAQQVLEASAGSMDQSEDGGTKISAASPGTLSR